LNELARQGAEAFIDAQKKLLDVAAQQVEINLKTARKAMDGVREIPAMALADLTRHTVDSFVAAQKALLDAMAKPVRPVKEEAPRRAPGAKAAARKRPEPVPA